MTITIKVPKETESLLQAEAIRTGLQVEQLVERVIAERFDVTVSPHKESAQEFFDRIARPGRVVDASRENIYADI